jgi:hypothetical protein
MWHLRLQAGCLLPHPAYTTYLPSSSTPGSLSCLRIKELLISLLFIVVIVIDFTMYDDMLKSKEPPPPRNEPI